MVENVGGLYACKCYIKVAAQFGTDAIYMTPGTRNQQNWQKVNCDDDPEQITHIFSHNDFLYKEYEKINELNNNNNF